MPDAGQRERGDGSFFLGKKKEPKKNRLGLSADTITYIHFRGYGFLIREAACIADLTRLLAMSQRRFFGTIICGSRDLVSWAFRDTANRGVLFMAGFARGEFTATQAGRLIPDSGRFPRLTIYQS